MILLVYIMNYNIHGVRYGRYKVNIQKTIEDSFLTYAGHVIQDRSIPDVRDGLKLGPWVRSKHSIPNMPKVLPIIRGLRKA